MKKTLIFLLIICGASFVYASETLNKFDDKYKALVPSENSSVNSDYLFEQIALGSEYTVKLLDQISSDHENLLEKLDDVNQKFDILIEQNSRIIKLLEK